MTATHPAALAMAQAVLGGDHAAARALADWLVNDSGFEAETAYYLLVTRGIETTYKRVVSAPAWLTVADVAALVEPAGAAGHPAAPATELTRVGGMVVGYRHHEGLDAEVATPLGKDLALDLETGPARASLWGLVTPRLAGYLLPFAEAFLAECAPRWGATGRAAAYRESVIDRLAAIAAARPGPPPPLE